MSWGTYQKTPEGLAYRTFQRGERPTILLLRGLGRSSQYWLGFDEKIAASFNVLCPDYRGLGQSTAAAGWRLNVVDMARDCQQILAAAQITKALVVGHSLGGMVAMAVAAHFPANVKGICLINSSAPKSGHLRITPTALATLLSKPIVGERFQNHLARVLLSSDASSALCEQTAKQWSDIEKQEGLPVLTVLKQLIAATFLKVDLQTITCPTLIIAGGRDSFVPSANSWSLHQKIKGSRLELIPNGGHELPVDSEEELRQKIVTFATEVFAR